jgi:hypothetical protein
VLSSIGGAVLAILIGIVAAVVEGTVDPSL